MQVVVYGGDVFMGRSPGNATRQLRSGPIGVGVVVEMSKVTVMQMGVTKPLIRMVILFQE